ncbi:MAG: sugar kinase [Treponema sp.]|jgi:NAD kinase|nr:sugar kinase [Treponema sp.]
MKKFENRIIIVKRETRLEKVLEAQNTISQARFYVKRLGGDFAEYEDEHNQYTESVKKLRQNLEELASIQVLDRKYLPNFIFAANDVVVVIGQDGLVANTLKYLGGQPLIGLNPDKSRWDGVLLPFAPEDAVKIIDDTIRGKRKYEEVTIAKARLQSGQELLAVNDFFIGQKTHTSARYVIKFRGLKEPQSSSGVIVSTGLGSTGWMKSIIAGASRLNASVIGRPYGGKQESEELTEADEEVYEDVRHGAEEAAPAEGEQMLASEAKAIRRMRNPKRSRRLTDYLSADSRSDFLSMNKILLPVQPSAPRIGKKKTYGPSELSKVVGKWGAEELIFAVREPFPSKSTGTNLVFGKINGDEPLRLESLMGENGVIFSDGMEADFMDFNSGAEAVISIADKKGRIVV